MTEKSGVERAGLSVLVVDDVSEVRQVVRGFLADGGFPADEAESAVDLLYKLRERPYAVILLDIELGGGASCETLHELCHELFPHIAFAHRKLLATLGLTEESPASGRYLLPMVKAIAPETEVVMLSGTWREEDDGPLLSQLGAYTIIPKDAPDSAFAERPEGVQHPRQGVAGLQGLKAELFSFLDKICAERAPGPGRGADMGLEPISSTFLDDFLRRLLNERAEWKVGNVRAEILYYNQEQRSLEQISQVNFGDTLEAMRIRKVASDFREGEGICSYAARTKEVVLATHVRFDRRYRSVVDPDRTQSELVVPLEFGGRFVGLANLESDLPRAFGNRHLERLLEVAPFLALLVEFETFRFEESFMGRMAERLSGLGEAKEIFTAVLDAALELTGRSGGGAVLLPDREQEPRFLRVSHTIGLDLKPDEERMVASFGVIRDALADVEGQRYWSLEEHGTDNYVPLAADIRCEFVTVLRVSNRTLAVIDVESKLPALSERYRRAILRCSFYAASLVEGLRRRTEAERLRALDEGLTGASIEMHSARNIFVLLRNNLEQEINLSATSKGYLEEIWERLKDGEELVRSFQEPPRPIDLSDVLAKVKRRAEILHLRLNFVPATSAGTAPTIPWSIVAPGTALWVMGNSSGFIWLFENLISNSRRHARGGFEVEASLSVERNNARGRIRYWDNGQDPKAIDKFLCGRSKRQGWEHIQKLCKLYGWEVRPSSGKKGELIFEFTFEVLPGGHEADRG